MGSLLRDPARHLVDKGTKERTPPTTLQPAYETDLGRMFQCTIEEFLKSDVCETVRGKVDLIFTSPPFPLRRKKKYGNKQDDEYLQWLADLAGPLAELLQPKGSIVMEVGNAWEQGRPVMSTLSIEALLAFKKTGDLHLCQQFVCHNPARLPAPAQWVNVKRIRVKDSYTHVWWMSPTETPLADNRRVLKAYSPAMEKLLEKGSYNHGWRPSEYEMNPTSFLKRHGGAIPPSAIETPDWAAAMPAEVLEAPEAPSNFLQYSNTASTDAYLAFCREHALPIHPARMPQALAEFFVKFLTKQGGLVMDPFGGSNTTGAAAQELGRRWIACEPTDEYVQGSVGRFIASAQNEAEVTAPSPPSSKRQVARRQAPARTALRP